MKIALYINAINGGGAERVLVVLANELSKRGHDVVFVTSYPAEGEYPLCDGVVRENLEPVEVKDSFLARNTRRILRLRSLITKHNPDVLLAFMAEPNIRALAASVATGVPTVVSVRNDPRKEYGSAFLKVLADVLFRRAAHIVFQTNEAREFFPSAVQRKSSVILNPVDEKFFDVTANPLSDVVVTCARLAPQKNQAMLIEAFDLVSKRFPHATLEIYGSGELRGDLETLISMRDLGDRVFLKGDTPDVPFVLSHAGVFVLPSLYEGLPNALMEAQAAGVASVATDCPCGGPRMLIEDGVDGYLSDFSAEMFSEKLASLLADGGLRMKMSAAARTKAQAYRSSHVVDEWEALLVSLAALKKRRG